MLTISKSQIKQIELRISDQLVFDYLRLLKEEHLDLYSTMSEEKWLEIVQHRIEQAKDYEIFSSQNQFAFILTCSSYPSLLPMELPGWAKDILNWPGRNEDDKIILICKEIFKHNNQK
jgi:hypothetical protein